MSALPSIWTGSSSSKPTTTATSAQLRMLANLRDDTDVSKMISPQSVAATPTKRSLRCAIGSAGSEHGQPALPDERHQISSIHDGRGRSLVNGVEAPRCPARPGNVIPRTSRSSSPAATNRPSSARLTGHGREPTACSALLARQRTNTRSAGAYRRGDRLSGRGPCRRRQRLQRVDLHHEVKPAEPRLGQRKQIPHLVIDCRVGEATATPRDRRRRQVERSHLPADGAANPSASSPRPQPTTNARRPRAVGCSSSQARSTGCASSVAQGTAAKSPHARA